MNCELMLTYDTPALRQTGSRNLMGQKPLPTIWHTYMKLVTKYQIAVINSCLEKCDEKCALNVKINKSANRKQESDGSNNASHDMGYLYDACDQISYFCHQQLLRKMRRKMCIYVHVYTNQQSQQTGSRNLMGSKTLPTIWGTHMKLVTKYRISAINSY